MDCIKMVVAMNPCPCGYYPGKKCKCSDYEIMHYRGKISGPILERIDIQKNVKHVDYFELSESEEMAPSSAELRKKVEYARKIQQERFRDVEGVSCNAQMNSSLVQKYCHIGPESTKLLKDASEKNGYSARVIHKLLRMARTSADLAGKKEIGPEDIRRVLSCRDLDNSNSGMYVV